MLEVLVAALIPIAASDAILRGVARQSETGIPIAGATIEVLGTGQRTWSDSSGAYALTLGQAGSYRLRVACLGYEARVLDVVVGTDDTLFLDIALTPRAVVLPQIAVLASAGRPGAVRDSDVASLSHVGARRFDRSTLRDAASLIDSDLFRAASALTSAEGVEPTTALHVRGGSGDQNLILVDGIPLLNPYHLGESMSALDASIVSSATVYPGVAPARYGGALSSVVSLRTDAPAAEQSSLTGAVSFTSARLSGRGLLPQRTGDFVISAKRRRPDLFRLTGNRTSTNAASDDAFFRSTLRLGTTSLTLLFFAGQDTLSFDSNAASSAEPSELLKQSDNGTSATQNLLGWRTNTVGAAWRAHTNGLAWTLRAWRTAFAGAISWHATSGLQRLRSAAVAEGMGLLVTRPSNRSTLTAGLDVEQQDFSYDVSSSLSQIRRSAAPRFAAVHAEEVWQPIERWSLAAGLRATVLANGPGYLDPRLSVRHTPTSRTTVSFGYSQVHQSVQSLRNEESLVDDLVGVALPITEGGELPVTARGDQVTLAADHKVGVHSSITADVYARRLTGLLLVAPLTAAPFATDKVVVGHGRAAGASLSYAYSDARTFARMSYALSANTRAGAGVSYRPSFGQTHSLLASVGLRPRQTTWLRSSVLATAGRVSSVYSGLLEWAHAGMAGNGQDIAGSPEQIIGAVSAARLPAYLRLDVGLRQAWRRSMLGRGGDIVLALDLINVLGARNLSGFYQPRPEDATRRAILMSPRRVDLSLRWEY